MEQKLITMIDDYIRHLYVEAYHANKDSIDIPYYAKLKPLAFIMLRSLILADYEINKDSMPDRPEEIFSGKTLSRIVEKYEIENQLKTLTLSVKGNRFNVPSFYHRKFTGSEADWVLVAVWIWIEKRDLSISPLKYFKECDNIFERSRLYIINKAESLSCPEFFEYFKDAPYEILVDKYDIMKGWLPSTVKRESETNKKLTELEAIVEEFEKNMGKCHENLADKVQEGFDMIGSQMGEQNEKTAEHYKNLQTDINEMRVRQKGIPAAVKTPIRKAIFDVLNEVKLFFDDNSDGNEGILFDNLNNIFVITTYVTLKDVIHKIRDVRDEKGIYFGPDELLLVLKAENEQGEPKDLSFSTVQKYLQPSSI